VAAQRTPIGLVALEEGKPPGGVCHLADRAEGVWEVVGPVALVFPDASIAIEVGGGVNNNC